MSNRKQCVQPVLPQHYHRSFLLLCFFINVKEFEICEIIVKENLWELEQELVCWFGSRAHLPHVFLQFKSRCAPLYRYVSSCLKLKYFCNSTYRGTVPTVHVANCIERKQAMQRRRIPQSQSAPTVDEPNDLKQNDPKKSKSCLGIQLLPIT